MNKSDLTTSAADYFPARMTLPALRNAAKNCHGCHLYRYAKQTVFGEGPANAKLMVIGEIPGDKEDQLGKPFVGPAGIFLRKTFEEAGINTDHIYLTNVVKHFKFVRSGSKKLHRSPVAKEIKACKPWLHAEFDLIKPSVVLCLGATAAKTVIRKNFLITKERGKWIKLNNQITIIVTFHPSAILRAPDEAARHEMKRLFRRDIKKIAVFLFK